MRKITFAACISCILVSASVQAQLFKNRIGKSAPREFSNSVTQQLDSSYLIGGNYRNTFYGKDYPAIIHLKKNGSVDWVRQLNLPNQPSAFVQYAEAVRNTAGKADGYIAVLNAGSSIFLVRLSNSGTVIWARQLTNTSFSSNYVLRVKPAYSSANSLPAFYILATHFSGGGEMVIKTNASGSILWQKRITHPTSGNSYIFRDLKVTSDSGCVVTGYVQGTTSNSVIFKFSPTGSVTFAKSYDFFSTTSAGGFGISQLSGGGYVVTGSDGSSDDNLTFKVTSAGAISWGYKYTNVASNDLAGQAIVSDALGNIIVAGSLYPGATANSAFLMKLNSSGSVLFSKEYDAFSSQYSTYNDEDINDLKLTNQGYCFAGTASPSNVLSDIFVVQTNTSGDVSSACLPTSVTYSRVAAEFNSVVNATYTVVNEALTNTSITVTSPAITTQELRCGTAEPASFIQNNLQGTLSAYAFGGNIKIEYKVPGTDNNKYDVKLMNLNGDIITASSLQANQPVLLSSGRLQNGMYIISLYNKGVFVAQQKIMIGQ